MNPSSSSWKVHYTNAAGELRPQHFTRRVYQRRLEELMSVMPGSYERELGNQCPCPANEKKSVAET